MAITRPSGTRDFNYSQDMAIVRTRWQWILLLVGLILYLTCPLFLNPSVVNLVNLIGIIIIVVGGLNIATGYCGQINIGQAAFMAVGAYTSVLLVTHFGLNFLLALVGAAIVAGLATAFFALPAARIKGFYLAMATLAAHFIIITAIAHPLEGISGGYDGIIAPPPKIGGMVFNHPESMFYIIAPFMLLSVFCTKNLVRTGVGRAFIAIRDNDLAAEVQGINVFYYKVLAFLICGLYAGVAGSLWAHWIRHISPDHFLLMHSIWYLGMLIVGGLGSTTGGVFGVIFLLVLDHYLKTGAMLVFQISPSIGAAVQSGGLPILYGLIIMLFVIFEPRGLAHRWEVFKSSYRLRPFSY